MSKNNSAVIAFDDDDEFEEFPVDAFHTKEIEEDEKEAVWEDGWEDETIGADFSAELRAELEKMGHKAVI